MSRRPAGLVLSDADRDALRDRIREAAAAIGSRAEAAAAAGVSLRMLKHYVAGRSLPPKRATLERLAQASGRSLDWLTGGHGPASDGEPPGANAREAEDLLDLLWGAEKAIERIAELCDVDEAWWDNPELEPVVRAVASLVADRDDARRALRDSARLLASERRHVRTLERLLPGRNGSTAPSAGGTGDAAAPPSMTLLAQRVGINHGELSRFMAGNGRPTETIRVRERLTPLLTEAGWLDPGGLEDAQFANALIEARVVAPRRSK